MRYMTPTGEVNDFTNGSALKSAMDERGVTVAQLSKATGLSTRTITAIRNGKSGGNGATWVAISRALGVALDSLVG